MNKTHDVALGGIYSAVSIIFLYLACIMPTGKLAFAFVASCMPAFACAECRNRKIALVCGISSGIIAFLLLPKQGLGGVISVFFSLALCYYPSVKSLLETRLNIAWEWILKVIYFFGISFVISFISKKLGVDVFNVFLCAGAFIAYDLLLSMVIGYYVKKISPILRKH